MMTYVVATDQCCSVRQFVWLVYATLDFQPMRWMYNGVNEVLRGRCCTSNELTLVQIDPELFRPGEVPYLRGDVSKIKKELGWHPSTSLEALVAEMIDYNWRRIYHGSRPPKL